MSTGALFQLVKDKLRIAHSDPDTDRRIRRTMEDAEQELIRLLGIHEKEFDFAKPGTERLLFLAFCYYDFNDAMDDFEKHYGSQIGRCRDEWMVKQYVEEKAAAADVS